MADDHNDRDDAEALLRAVLGDDFKAPPPGAAAGINDRVDVALAALGDRECRLVIERIERRATSAGIPDDPGSLGLRFILGFCAGRLLSMGASAEALSRYLSQMIRVTEAQMKSEG